VGRKNPDGAPQAELWMGAHPSAPSLVKADGELIGLDEYIDSDPEAVLGSDVVAEHGPALPFLFKVLAADEPLSIQCHPSRIQAQAGFARENAAKIPIDAPHRNYRDDNHKPELIVALTRFLALKGFREPAEIASLMRSAGLETLEPELVALETSGDLRGFFQHIMTLDSDRRQRVLGELAAGIERGTRAEFAWVRELLERYRGDIGALSPLYLNLVELQPGEGLYLPAGELHAYLRGAGLELMANSDNVLRGGLTPKHVDVPELLATVVFEAQPSTILRPHESNGGRYSYVTPASEFHLSTTTISGEPRELRRRNRIELVLCTEGSVSAATKDGSVTIRRGECWMIPAFVGAVRYSGDGQLYFATVS
jgi:mannose-6-phosphate isomerase